MIRFRLLAALVIMILGCLFVANFGIKRVVTGPQTSLLDEVQGDQNKVAVQRYIDQSNLRKNRYMQQLIVVSIVGLAVVMIVFNTSIFNRVNAMHLRLKGFLNGKDPDFPVQSGTDEISLLSNEIGKLVERNIQIQRDLAFSEECFQAHIADHSELVCRLAPNGTLTFVNGCFCDFFGKQKDDLIGTKLLGLIEGSDKGLMQEQLDELTAQQGTTCDAQVVDGNGKPKRISWSWRLIANGSRKEAVIQGTGRDTTREWAVIQSESRQRKLEAALLSISTKLISLPTERVDACITDVLRGISEFLQADNGYVYRFRKTELTATHLWRSDENVIPKLQGVSISLSELDWATEQFEKDDILLVGSVAELPEEAENVRYLMKQAGVASLIMTPLMHDSTLAGLLVFDFGELEQTFDDDIKPFLKIAAAMVGNALARKEDMLNLEGGQQRIQTIFSAIQTGIFVTNLRSREIVDANDRACDMVGLSKDELLGSLCLRVFDSLPAMQGDPGEGASWSVEDALKDSSGNRLPVLRTTVTIIMQNELHLVESVVDLSGQKKLQNQRMQNERLQGVLEMAGAACHELNQPLQVISGYIDLLMMKIPEDDPNYNKISLIAEQIKRLGDITGKINNITTYETQDYLSGRIIDIEKSGALLENQPLGLPADKVNELLAVLRKQNKDEG